MLDPNIGLFRLQVFCYTNLSSNVEIGCRTCRGRRWIQAGGEDTKKIKANAFRGKRLAPMLKVGT